MEFHLNIDKNAEERVDATLHGKSVFSDRLEELCRSYSGDDSLTVYTDDEMRVLKIRDIECVTVIDGKTYAIDANGERCRLRGRLYEIEERLPQYFIRINKSSIANRRRIERFAAVLSGSVDAVFKSGYRDYVSRRCFAVIKKEWKK